MLSARRYSIHVIDPRTDRRPAAAALGQPRGPRLPRRHRSAPRGRSASASSACTFGPVDNLWARRGARRPVLCFAGHTDVVPTGPREEWRTDPFEPVVTDGVLYGRGAADMKSGLAAMVTATERFVAGIRAPRHRSPSCSRATRKARRSTARAASSRCSRRGTNASTGASSASRPAPSALGDTIKIGRRGSLSGRLTVHGVQGHIAYPQLADNPVHGFAPALAELAARTLGRRATSSSSRRRSRSRTSRPAPARRT